MKKTIKYLVFSLLMLFGFSLNVNAETLPAAVDGKITLDKDYTIDAWNLNPTKNIKVFDLNNHTLTVNGQLGIELPCEIKNGTIVRGSSFASGPIIRIKPLEDGTVTLKNIVVDGNKVQTTEGYGQGIFIVDQSSVILDNVTLKNNYATNSVFGAALYATRVKNITIKNSNIYDNKAEASVNGNGGGLLIVNCDSLEIINSKVYNNSSVKSATVYLDGVKNFVFDKDSIVQNNNAEAAAGIRIYNSNATISGTIEGNKSLADNGGGIYTHFLDDTYKNYVVRITETAKIINNTSAFAGGGLYVNSYKNIVPGKVIIDGATFSGNKALGTVDASDGLYKDIGGGAIAVARGILEINDIKMSGNTASANKGNSIIVSHANGNANGGKLTINGGEFDNSIDLGVGSIVVNGGSFKTDISMFLGNKLAVKKTENGYEVIDNTTLNNGNVTFDNDAAMDNNYELVVTEKEADKELVSDIKSVITKEAKGAKDINVLAMYDISVSDGTSEVEMKDGNYRITINLDERLLKYNSYAGVYVDDDGNVEYLPVEVKDGKAVIITGHLSTYGIVGYNISNPATNSNAEVIVSIILFVLMFVGIGFGMKKQETNA
ncbi:MAG: right-handed parallel beta-helix repeat-containing protein [Bacilli bacterium]|nr:right-handed parallel beta-helix repeat-containing protein [Bacilli bacterium]